MVPNSVLPNLITNNTVMAVSYKQTWFFLGYIILLHNIYNFRDENNVCMNTATALLFGNN